MDSYTVIAGAGLPAVEARAGESESFNWSDPKAVATLIDGGSISAAGETVTHEKALTLSPVWRAVSMISGDFAKLPVDVFARTSDGGRDKFIDHPAWDLIQLMGKANEDFTAWQLWRRAAVHFCLWNNAYIWIERQGTRPVGLYNLLPDRTWLERHRGRLFVMTEVNRKIKPLFYDDVIHIQGPEIDLDDCDLVRQAREDFGRALARKKFASRFFQNNCHSGGILQVPPGASKEARDRMEKAIEEKMRDPNKAFRSLVLRDNFKWTSTSVEPEKSQIVEFDEADVCDVARWFNMQPSRLGVRNSVSYNSQESDIQDYLDTTLSPWVKSRDTQLHTKLLTETERRGRKLFIESNTNAILWMNPKERNTIASTGIQSGRYMIDETRAWDNLNPLPGGWGSKPLRPANMVVAGEEPNPDAKRSRTSSRAKTDPNFPRKGKRK